MLSGTQGFRASLPDTSLREALSVTGISLLLVALLTAGLATASLFFDPEHVTIIFLVPVLFAAFRGGVIPAVISALAGVSVLLLFFYPPFSNFHSYNLVNIIDLILFVLVAVITGQLAANVRRSKMRADAEALREALIGSVSHELRTPLASILGSASVLGQSPKIAEDRHLSGLVRVLREESERLNNDIQNLLDATRISSEGVRPQSGWVDPGDIVNAAVERKRGLLTSHRLAVVIAQDLPLVHVDAGLIEKALGQLIENAMKYSAPASLIEIWTEHAEDAVSIAVRDQGMGLSAQERVRMWERLYRSPRLDGTISGSGLGLWIARSLVTACGGTVKAFSEGVGRGATLFLHLPVRPHVAPEPIEEPNE